MEEIKFKAWDKKAKKMVTGLIVWDLLCDYEELGLSDYIFMQYTGLKDKNGKEIYDRDICEWIEKRTYLVKFGLYDNEESYEEGISGYGFYLKKINGNDWSSVRGFDNYPTPKDIEIIGNIYENPELLK